MNSDFEAVERVTTSLIDTDIEGLAEDTALLTIPPIYLDPSNLLTNPSTIEDPRLRDQVESENSCLISKLHTAGLTQAEIAAVILHTGCGRIPCQISPVELAHMFDIPTCFVTALISSGINKVKSSYADRY